MALEATVTKLPVSLGDRNMATFGVKLVLEDGGVEVLSQNIPLTRPKNSDPELVAVELTAQAQAVINDYKAEQNIYNHAKYDALVAAVQNGISV